jgi:hypothetical protein
VEVKRDVKLSLSLGERGGGGSTQTCSPDATPLLSQVKYCVEQSPCAHTMPL